MKNILTAILVFALGIALSIAIVKSKPKPTPTPATAPPAPLVEFIQVSPTDMSVTVHSEGNVQAATQITLSAQVSGKIIQVSDKLANGAFFEKGDVLLQLESSDYELAIIKTELRIAEAREQLASERAKADQAKREWHDLGQQDANDLFLRKPQLERAQAQLRAAIAERDEAKLKLQRTTVKAPFNGRVESRQVGLGQFINSGTTIAKLYATDTFEVRLPLTEKQLALIELPSQFGAYSGAKPTEQRQATKPNNSQEGSQKSVQNIQLSAFYNDQHYQWQARLSRSEASININNRMLYLIAEVDHPYDRRRHQAALNIGSFVRADITSKTLPQAFRIPRSALQVDQRIFLINDKLELQGQSVNILAYENEYVIVSADIDPQQRIMTSNLPTAVDGLKVALLTSPTLIQTPSADSVESK
jgi:RND family efflux transporter MFP subunit